MSPRTGHLWMGTATMVAFVATGTYLLLALPERFEESLLIRTLFRTNHVYILFAGLLNLAVGVLYPVRTVPAAARWAKAGSLLLVLAPPVLVAAFVVEPPRATDMRPLTSVGVLLAFVAVLAHLRSSRLQRRGRRDAA